MTNNGRSIRVIQAARIGRAFSDGPLTLYGACLAAYEMTEREWNDLPISRRNALRNRVQRLLDCLTPGPIGGKVLAQDTQGRTTLYWLIET